MRDIDREPITDDVLSQLRDVLDSGRLDDPHNWMGAQFAARDLGHDALAEFIVRADASTYHEALGRVYRQQDEGDEEGEEEKGKKEKGDEDEEKKE